MIWEWFPRPQTRHHSIVTLARLCVAPLTPTSTSTPTSTRRSNATTISTRDYGGVQSIAVSSADEEPLVALVTNPDSTPITLTIDAVGLGGAVRVLDGDGDGAPLLATISDRQLEQPATVTSTSGV
jgi:hypothetical protein